MMDPKKADLLLQKASNLSAREQAIANRRMHAWLVQLGLDIGQEGFDLSVESAREALPSIMDSYQGVQQ